MSTKEIANIFRMVADKVEAGTCAVDVENLTEIANSFVHIKMNAEQTCSYLGVSRSTLSRMVADGRVPYPHKDRGGDKVWYMDEVDDYITKYKDKYGLN